MGGRQPGMCGFHPCYQKKQGRKQWRKGLQTPVCIHDTQIYHLSSVCVCLSNSLSCFSFVASCSCSLPKRRKRTDVTWQSPAKNHQVSFGLLQCSCFLSEQLLCCLEVGDKQSDLICCVRIKRNYCRSMLSSELFGGCLRCWLHLVGLHWPKRNDRSVMILWC